MTGYLRRRVFGYISWLPFWVHLGTISLLMLGDGVSGAGFDGIPGDYCKTRRPTCCPSRDDDCTTPILDTLCYCDMFCDRPDGGDCCPDFKAVCLGITAPPPPQPILGECLYNGVQHNIGAKVRQNCNKCVCDRDPNKPGSSRWFCEENACLIQEDILSEIQQQGPSIAWRASNYSDFWGMTLTEGVMFRLGTLYPERSVENMNEILITPADNVPEQFDVRQKWPGFIHKVRDQGNCGSSWAFSTTSLSSDRLAIQSEGKVNVDLSPQQLLSCNQHRQKGCEGGYLDRAWWYIRKLGVVSESCYPYESGKTDEPGNCRIPKNQFKDDSVRSCPSGILDTKVYKMTPPYRLSKKEVDIQTELMTNGPVQATFLVHEDFYLYKGGVYQHTKLAEKKGPKFAKSGYHSVRLLGWGVDHSSGRPVKYWLADNSWGEQWGENGLFKILRGENHCQVESYIVGAWGKGSKKRKRRLRLRGLNEFLRRI